VSAELPTPAAPPSGPTAPKKVPTPEQQVMHDAALAAGQETYYDPAVDKNVRTALAHLNRGYCCDSGCRHCPY